MKTGKWIVALLMLSMAAAGNAWADRDGRNGRDRHGSHYSSHSGLGALGTFLGVVGTIAVIDAVVNPPRVAYPPPQPYYPTYAPPYYPPAVIVERPRSPVYIEQAAGLYAPQPSPANVPPPPTGQTNYLPPAVATMGNSFWYYCKESGAYYPYVRECPDGWLKVPATPPDLR